MSRLLVTGSRDWTNADAIAFALGACCALFDRRVTLIHGDCPTGADALADEIWRALVPDLPVEPHPADWDLHGKAAGPIRNSEMVALGADLCLAFPLEDSRGTRDCMSKAKAAGIPVIEIGEDTWISDISEFVTSLR